ncbi:MAG: hypothetical protein AAGB34_03445 [Planctomycetota bacterium]
MLQKTMRVIGVALVAGAFVLAFPGCQGVKQDGGYTLDYGNDTAEYNFKSIAGDGPSAERAIAGLFEQQGFTKTGEIGHYTVYTDAEGHSIRASVGTWTANDGGGYIEMYPTGSKTFDGYRTFLDQFFAGVRSLEKERAMQIAADAKRVNDTVRTQTVPHRTHVPHHHTVPKIPKGHY